MPEALDSTSLTELRTFVTDVAAGLDPHSRYVSDLLDTISLSSDPEDLERRLLAGCRGQRHAGEDVFAKMTLKEKLLANLITPETSLFRFSEGELEAIDRQLLPTLAGRTARILVVPCSHGEEAFTIAAYFLKVRVPFVIRAYDVQPALIDEARTGRLTFGYPPSYLDAPGRVARHVLDHVRFEVGDAFRLPLAPVGEEAPFDVVLCRNFVGYFTEPRALELVEGLAARVGPGGVLFLDSFCVGKHTSLVARLVALGFVGQAGRPVFQRR